jgi:hypothetical protein
MSGFIILGKRDTLLEKSREKLESIYLMNDDQLKTAAKKMEAVR